jgi:hypothetical protein
MADEVYRSIAESEVQTPGVKAAPAAFTRIGAARPANGRTLLVEIDK